MKRVTIVLPFVLLLAAQCRAQDQAPLRLRETITVPGVTRKWDHFGVDSKGGRLFATSEKDPAIEVFDLKTNKHLRTLTDFG